MSELIENKKSNWIAELAFEYALGYFSPEELQLKYELTAERFALLQNTKTFKQAVQAYRREIDEAGEHFKLKARRMASEVLDVLFDLAGDPETSSSDRIKAIGHLCKYAGFDKEQESDASTGITIQIANFSEPPS